MNKDNKPTKPNLATLNMYAAEILQIIEADGGEVSEKSETALQLINDKLLGGCFALDKRKEAINDKKAMIKELQASIKRDQRSIEFLEPAVLGVMKRLGVEKIESYKRFSVAKKRGRVEVAEDKVSNKFLKVAFNISFDLSVSSEELDCTNLIKYLSDNRIYYTLKHTPNKTAIKEAIERGEVVPGAELIENEFSIRIK